MKKLITILTIMIVLVGAVFATDPTNTLDGQAADGTAQINVTAKVLEAIPQFQLAIAANQSGVIADAVANITNRTVTPAQGQTPASISAAQTTKVNAALTATSVSKLTGTNGETAADVTVNFAINQIAKANLKAGYEITVTANPLILTSFLDGKTLEQAGVTYSAAKHSFALKSGSATPEVTANGTSVEGLTKAADDNVLTVTYTGAAQVSGSAETPQPLGTFSVTWEKNEAAVAGNYEGIVQIVVASK